MIFFYFLIDLSISEGSRFGRLLHGLKSGTSNYFTMFSMDLY